MSMTIDKRNGDICFNEQAHVYFSASDNKKKFTSVTTLIHKFEPPFDKDFWSAYKAAEQLVEPDYWKLLRQEMLASKKWNPKWLDTYGIPAADFNAVQQNILDNWQKENLASTKRGSSIHAGLEQSFYAQKTDISLQKYGLGGKFVCVEGRTELDLENGIYPEYLIYYESPDGKLRLAGQIDLLVKEGDSFSILDWKGLPLDTKIPTLKGWTTMGELKVGDKVFDMNGQACSVIHKSEVHHNPCYKITFATGESIVADEDHRWVISLLENAGKSSSVFTTKYIAQYMAAHPDRKLVLPTCKPLEMAADDMLPMEENPNDTIGKQGVLANMKAALRTSLEKRTKVLKLLTKYISVSQHSTHYVISDPMFTAVAKEFLATFGIISKMDNGSLMFRMDYEGIIRQAVGKLNSYRAPYFVIESVEPVETVETQCIEVDSPSHTYLCTEEFLVTHNTNKQIKKTSFYDKKTKTSEKLKYPLNNLDNCNYSVYNMQLSTYAWMIQQLHPEWKCKELILVHFDHSDNMTTYKMDYLKDEVEKMLTFWKKESVLEEHKASRKRIEY